MKNIHILPTDKPSRLHFTEFFEELVFTPKYEKLDGVNIYITSDEEIKDSYVINTKKNKIYFENWYSSTSFVKKIILTTDADLIKDGVQAIDDEFLEWFIENPSYEFVEVRKEKYSERFDNDKSPIGNSDTWGNRWLIIIPKKKSKQETLEKAAENYAISKDSSSIFIKVHKKDFINGAKWQEQQTIEEVFEWLTTNNYLTDLKETLIEQFKNK